jgi:hypothetical protein
MQRSKGCDDTAKPGRQLLPDLSARCLRCCLYSLGVMVIRSSLRYTPFCGSLGECCNAWCRSGLCHDISAGGRTAGTRTAARISAADPLQILALSQRPESCRPAAGDIHRYRFHLILGCIFTSIIYMMLAAQFVCLTKKPMSWQSIPRLLLFSSVAYLASTRLIRASLPVRRSLFFVIDSPGAKTHTFTALPGNR